MHTLELKIPPLVIVLLTAAAMWGGTLFVPSLEIPYAARLVATLVFALSGLGISIAGVVSFRRARTTVNPTKPHASSALVNSGVYRMTRNPMYLGFLLQLIGWAVFLSNLVAFIGPIAFVLYINRFQIAAEEAALSKIFGDAFAEYQSKVRRWL